MTGPVDDYLRRLRTGLRTRPEETERILAEAADHLRESVAAGVAAGLTDIDAQEAAISAFGSVSAVVRAHTTHRIVLRAVVTDLLMVAWKLTWLSLLAFGAVQSWLALEQRGIGLSHAHVTGVAPGQVLKGQPAPPGFAFLASWMPGWMLILGLVLAVGYRLVRTRRPDPLGGFFPLVATVFFVAATPVSLAAGSVNGVAKVQGGATAIVMAGLAAVYAARMAGTLISERTLIWQRRTS